METLTAILVLGLLAQQGLCQFNPAMLAALSGGGGSGGGGPGGLGAMGLGMAAGGEMGNMNDLMMYQALAGAGSGGRTGGIDPMTLMMLGGAGGAAAAPSSDMMQQMALMNMMRQQSNTNQQPAGGSRGGQQSQQQQTSMATTIANMLAGPNVNSGITPGQQNALWGAVQMSNNAQRVMDAVTQPTDRIPLERDGLPGVNPMMTMTMCPRPTQCAFPFCENTEIPFTAESFYICRGCPRCRMDASQRNMMNMMSQMGGAGGANPGQMMLMMRAMGQGGAGGAGGAAGGAGAMNPAMMMALMNMQQQQQQQQQQPQSPQQATQATMTIPAAAQKPRPVAPVMPPAAPSTENQTPSRGPPRTPAHGPRPPPEFIAAMRAMSSQMRNQNGGTTPRQGSRPTTVAAGVKR